MRFGSVVACLAVGGLIGWLVGSRYPAPQAWLGAIEEQVNRLRADESAAAPQPATTEEQAADGVPNAGSGGAVENASLHQLRAWFGEARRKHPYTDSEDRMYAVMMCESRGQAKIVNPAGPYYGLFQYSRQTWDGDWNQYRKEDILNPRAQIFATALAWQRGMQGQWGCYKRAH